jgi:hypothetical protein
LDELYEFAVWYDRVGQIAAQDGCEEAVAIEHRYAESAARKCAYDQGAAPEKDCSAFHADP